MPETVTGLLLLVAFSLPGFVLVQASRRDKLYKPRSDFDFVLRGLAFSLIVHLVFFAWTVHLYRDLEDEAAATNRSRLQQVLETSDAGANAEVAASYAGPVSALDVWSSQAIELLLYGVIVIAVAPIGIGLLLGGYLRKLEFAGGSPWWGDLLGTVNPPRAWDALASQLGAGGWVVVRFRESGQVIGGKSGTNSLVNLGTEPDILLEELWWLDEYGNPLSPIEPRRAAWIGRDRIESLVVIPPETS